MSEEIDGTRTICIPSLAFNYVDNRLESIGYQGELYIRERAFESYDAGFSNGVKACLQQLDGLICEGADVDEIQAWVERQWEEETV